MAVDRMLNGSVGVGYGHRSMGTSMMTIQLERAEGFTADGIVHLYLLRVTYMVGRVADYVTLAVSQAPSSF